MKKLINEPDNVAREALEGLALAFPQHLALIPDVQAVIRRGAPIAGQVAVITGGGSGHEPIFAGYVGTGMAHASVAGHVFTSPAPQPIFATAKAAHAGQGVLLLYGNYAGDVLNFDVAAEMLAEDNITVQSVRICDDVASAPPHRRQERRGIAGDLFVIKAAGARAEEGGTLAEVAAAAEKANGATRSMGVALSSCSIPASGRPIFDLGAGEMEIGMGLHGEPGVQRAALKAADEVAEEILRRLLADIEAERGWEFAVLINGLGATPMCELLVVSRAVSHILDRAGMNVARTFIGNYATSLDMAGCSISIMRLDAELKRLLIAPADSPAFVQVQP
jgi:phosphoenolpyruvate---glycerone phosphotransferase subunit DhaK